MNPNGYPLSEAGINTLLEEYYGTPGYDDLLAAVEQFRNDVISQAESDYEWELEYGMVDDGYYDLCEPLEGEMTLDEAIGRLDAPGWGYTTNAMRIIEDFDSNDRWALEECEPGFVASPERHIFQL